MRVLGQSAMFDRPTRQGGYFALAAYCIWGVAPIYFKLVGHVQPLEIIAHRVTWSAILLMAVLALSGKLGELRLPLKSLGWLLLSAMLLACNWLIFVFAVLNDQIIDTSLGYFINPLVSVFLGIFFLGERLRPLQWLALSIAFLGVMIQLVVLGHLPLISLALAFSFGFYGLIRKTSTYPPCRAWPWKPSLFYPSRWAISRGSKPKAHWPLATYRSRPICYWSLVAWSPLCRFYFLPAPSRG